MRKSYQEAEASYQKLDEKAKSWSKEKFDKNLERARNAAGTNQGELDEKFDIEKVIHRNTRVSKINNLLKE